MTAVEKLKALNKENIAFTMEEYNELKSLGASVIYWKESKTYE